MIIQFYGTSEAYGAFSNFAAFPISIGGKTWPTSEHYFQAQKFVGTGHEEAIRKVSSPMIAARMGRDRKKPLRADWEQVKLDVMREALRAKFTQHADLRKLLIETGRAELVEHSKKDRFWGDGGDGSGRNMLGKLLMELRAALEDQPRE
jgi:ribA/ribD-fused uncharacterized protein